MSWAYTKFRLVIQIVKRSDDAQGFRVLPRRRGVERTFGWLVRNRRLARDYERLANSSKTMVKAATIRLMAARLAGESERWSNRSISRAV